ncbi:MAG TPA: hypothetical protein VM221_02045 [Armatimonadota bacterium]|nr:hypothetical protein [Armatimonadota bacterium]
MRTVVVMVVMGALLLSAGAAFAQYGYGGSTMPEEKPYLRAKVGWFEPSEGALDGDLAFGVDYIVARGETQLLYLTVDRLHAEDTTVENTAWSVLGGVYYKAKGGFYYGGGVGWSRNTLETVGLPDRDDDNLTWEVGASLGVGGKGFAEIKYRDGGQDGNTGVVLYVGTRY